VASSGKAGFSGLLKDLGGRILRSADHETRRIASRYGYLDYMIPRYREILGDLSEVVEMLEAFEKPLVKSVRINTLRFRDINEVVDRLEMLGYKLSKIPWERFSYVIVEQGRVPPGATHEFLLGGYYLYRGIASLIPPIALNPSPSDRVIDNAAAPGGKTTHIAQLMGNSGVVVAVDVSRERFRALRTNLERMGVENVLALRTDGRRVPELFGTYFTKALLDAPCTGEGIIQLDPSRKTKTVFDDLVRAHLRQVQLLLATIRATVPGGRIVYSTCSIAPEEDEFTVAEAIEEAGNVRIVKPDIPLKLDPGITEYFGIRLPEELKYCGRTYPHRHGMEGFFVCVLEKEL